MKYEMNEILNYIGRKEISEERRRELEEE